MAALVTCKYEEYPIKKKSLPIGQHFHHYKYMGANFRHSRTSNPEVNCLIWLKFELIRELWLSWLPASLMMIRSNLKALDRTRSNMGFFDSQGQVTPKGKVKSLQTQPRIYGCPGYLQV